MEGGGQSSDMCCSATARALDLFNRRGSLLAVALGGGNSESPLSPSCTSTKSVSLSGTACASSALPSPTTMTSSTLQSFAAASTSASTVVSNNVANASEPHSTNEVDVVAQMSIDQNNEWRPCYPRLCAYHDCQSLAAAWGLGPPTTSIEPRPTGASQAQSPCEDDAGDGKYNDLLDNCPSFRNELGGEPIRRLALTRRNLEAASEAPRSEHETWQREQTAAESAILEDVSNVYLGGRLCAARQPKIVIEPQDIGSYYYRHCFVGRPHSNYFGMEENVGPVAVSMIRENVERKESDGIHSMAIYRMIVRISDVRTVRVAVPEEAITDGNEQKSNRSVTKELLDVVCPQVHFACLRPAAPSTRVEDILLKIDEQPIYTRYKVGVMYCGPGQSTEEQMYNNEHSSPAFEEFLDFLGQRVRLKGFDQYKGGLDIRGDTTGTHSVYAEYQAHEIMFHVSTLLPFTRSNRQQLARKRHIGNDMVTVIFQEPGALPFSPITVRSHFQHVFIVVRVNQPCTDDVTYTIAVSRAKDVPAFGPPLPAGATYPKCADFHDFLLTKIINAENAVHRSKKFAAMAARTRREALKELVENFVSAHPNEGPSRIASRFLGGSVKRKERVTPRPMIGECIRGALSWLVDVHDHSMNQRVTCVLGVSAETIVLLEKPSGAVIFATPTHSLLGWANTDMGLKIYYDHGQMLLMRCCTAESSDKELVTLLRRLECVTKGDEAKEIIFRRAKASGSLGFHLEDEGVVTEVEMYQTAWKSGLRQGSRIVEIDGQPVITLTHEEMCQLLAQRTALRLMMISPAQDGSPRRGCEDPHCPAVKGHDNFMLTPDSFARQPKSYQELFKTKNVHVRRIEQWSSQGSGSSIEEQSAKPTKNAQLSSARSTTPRRYENHRITSSNYTPTSGAAVVTRVLKSKRLCGSAHAYLCELIQSPYNVRLLRAQSEEMLNFSEDCDEKKDAMRTFLDNSELSRCQMHLQKVIEEKRQLEARVEALHVELSRERRAHDLTRAELRKLQERLQTPSDTSK
uniref:Signal-induced proliferation-associated 1-like protein 2 n=2 Tax=Parascaris TaxID=6254 RepID=A0A914ZJN7_PARUN